MLLIENLCFYLNGSYFSGIQDQHPLTEHLIIDPRISEAMDARSNSGRFGSIFDRNKDIAKTRNSNPWYNILYFRASVHT